MWTLNWINECSSPQIMVCEKISRDFRFFFGWEKQKLPFSLKEKVNFSRALKNKPNGTTEIG